MGLNRLWRLEPPEPPNRYCRLHAGELTHIDVKKLGRFNVPGHRVTGRGPGHHNHTVGWEFVHVAIDDTSRLVYVEILDDEKGPTCVGFLLRAIAYFAAHGITVQPHGAGCYEIDPSNPQDRFPRLARWHRRRDDCRRPVAREAAGRPPWRRVAPQR